MATIYLILCTNKADDSFVEVSSACVSRKDAEQRTKNLRLNFQSHSFNIKTIHLNGVSVSQMENNCYIFDMIQR